MKISIVIIFVFLFSKIQSQNFDISGFVDSYHAGRIENEHDIMSSRTRFRTELKKNIDNSSLFVSVNSIYNSRIPELSKIEMREANLFYSSTNWDVKVGRQIIVWGQADGIQVTDFFSPLDLTEFLAQDYDDLRLPVDALKLRYVSNSFHIEGVFVPIYRTNILPLQDSPWGYDFSGPEGINIQMQNNLEPEKTLKNSEYGVRMTFNKSEFDFSVLALNTYNKMPEFHFFPIDQTNIILRQETHRLQVFGVNFSKPIWKIVFRSDVALNVGKSFAPNFAYMTNGMQKSNTVNYLIGIDLYPGNDWNVAFQYNQDHILKYNESFGIKRDTYLGTVNISKPIFNNSVLLSTFAYIDLEEMEFFDRSSIDISASDQIHFLFGVDVFKGEKGVYGQYKKNSELWIKAKYSF